MKSPRFSFAAGEISPQLHGRLDLAKNETGLKACRNWLVLPHGPVTNRPGLEFVNEAMDSTRKVRILPFTFNTEQVYFLEFGHLYLRIHQGGGTILEASQNITGITQANPGVLTYAGADPANGDWMYLAGISGMTALNGRYVKVAGVNAGANTFQLTDLWGANINTTALAAYTSGGTMSRVYTLATPYTETDLFDLHIDQSGDVLTITHPGFASRELRRLGATNWQLATVTFGTSAAAPTGVTATASGAGAISYSYVVTSVSVGGIEESIASTAGTCSNDLTIAGRYNDITWTAPPGITRFNVYRLYNGLYGYIGTGVGGTTFRDQNIQPDMTVSPPEAVNPYAATGDYPSTVCYYEQRRVFAGTDNDPQGFKLTRSGTESNLNSSFPVTDADAISQRIKGDQNRIRHVVNGNDLFLLTGGAVWRIYPQNSDVLTPSNVAARKQAKVGAANVQPIVTSDAVVFVQAGARRLRELVFSSNDSRYRANDLLLLAPHLTKRSKTIVEVTYSDTPVQTIWAVRSDGVLLGQTYLPEQQVYAWHRHDTAGFIESAAAGREDNEDVLYCVVRRTVNGRSVRYIERLGTREFDTLEDCFFVDAGLTYDGTATATITGLWHLEGKVVSSLADGREEPPHTVTNGQITLSAPASLVHVGLPIEADVETLPLGLALEAGGATVTKNVNKVYLQVENTSGLQAGPTFDKLRSLFARGNEPFGTPPTWKNGKHPLPVDPTWTRDAGVVFRQSSPLPATILSIVLDVATGG